MDMDTVTVTDMDADADPDADADADADADTDMDTDIHWRTFAWSPYGAIVLYCRLDERRHIIAPLGMAL